jgi:4-amino-4-deoxy-L-arabinose transferase-like glycosyltransferase
LLKLSLKPTLIGLVLFAISMAYYTHAALTFPVLFNLDNHLNYAATEYIAEHRKIPVVKADDPEILFTEIGTTRSLRPPFTFIVSALASNLTANIIDHRITRQRLGAPLIGALTVVVVFVGFWLAFNHIGLALLGATTIGLLPKFVFLASCNNDDIGAILSVSLLFTCVLALVRYQAKVPVLIALAFSVGLVLQTKFTAWLVLPWFGIFCLILIRSNWRSIVKLTPLLAMVFILAGGWWIVFNMINYGVTDPSAIRQAVELQTELSSIQANSQGYLSIGIGLNDLLANHDQFLTKSFRSLIGYLQWLELNVGAFTYLFYGLLFLVGFVGLAFASRVGLEKRAYLDYLVVILVLSQCVFYFHHNLLRDIQPQARYVLPVIMPLVYLFLRQLERLPASAIVLQFRGRQYASQSLVSSALIGVCVLVHLVAMERYIMPAFNAKPYFTSLKKPQRHEVRDAFEISSSNALTYKLIDNRLQLQREGTGPSSITLSPHFCDRLPLNALITMNVLSMTNGGFSLHIDRLNQGSYDSVYWRSVPAGESVAIFSVNSQNCSGVKISLSRSMYQLTLESLDISELRIHQHGKPL